MDKEKKAQNKQDSKQSKENGLKERKKNNKNQKIVMTSRKETYGEERKVKNNKRSISSTKIIKYHALAPIDRII